MENRITTAKLPTNILNPKIWSAPQPQLCPPYRRRHRHQSFRSGRQSCLEIIIERQLIFFVNIVLKVKRITFRVIPKILRAMSFPVLPSLSNRTAILILEFQIMDCRFEPSIQRSWCPWLEFHAVTPFLTIILMKNLVLVDHLRVGEATKGGF